MPRTGTASFRVSDACLLETRFGAQLVRQVSNKRNKVRAMTPQNYLPTIKRHDARRLRRTIDFDCMYVRTLKRI